MNTSWPRLPDAICPTREEKKMPHFMSIHNEPSVPVEKVESRWMNLAQESRAVWIKTWHVLDLTRRFCWWDAPDKKTLEEIFRDSEISWEEIVPVRLTIPSEWRWRED
ncbi:MAG: DUF4242 domain-containing protein [Desulfomonile tiedjei]|nr:DUF4242 domain-containing protein [Desulfomonile tiedjei]